VRGWFEGAGWKEPEDWPPTARLLFEAIDGIVRGDMAPWNRFLESEYRHGFGTGFVSPILFCIRNKVGMLTTEALILIIKRHDQFPFSIVELRRLFEVQGLAQGIEDELGRIYTQHDEYIRLTSKMLQIFDELQRQQDISEPISSRAINLYLLGYASQEGIAPPDRRQIDHVLALLSNPVLDILAQEEGGYVLTIPPGVARKRLKALEGLLSGEE